MKETNTIPNVVIVVARCNRTKDLFGMRFEEKSRHRWVADWAFPIQETMARKEGYDRNQIQGSFDFDYDYPGCPDCHAGSIFQCSCDKIACWQARRLPCVETCPWCGAQVTLSDSISSIKAGGDL